MTRAVPSGLAGLVSGAVMLLAASGHAAERTPQDFVLSDPPKRLPAITFETGDGTTADFGLFRGKVTLVNIWATWCGPCRHEMPTLDRLQASLGGPDFEVVALSIDRAGRKPVEQFFRQTGVENLAIYIDRSMKAMRALSVPVLPTTLLVGPDGREVARLAGPAAWDAPAMVDYLRSWITKLSPAAPDPAREETEAKPKEGSR